MHVVVCVKQVVDTTQPRIDPVSESWQREGIADVVNPFDFAALECALKLKDIYDARVTLLSMGPPDAAQTLQQCFAYGADRAVLLSDETLAGSDTFATSYALSAAIRRLAQEDPVSFVLCGRRSSDGATGQTGPGIARHLDWQQITCAREIVEVNMEAGTIIADRALECGLERVRTKLPTLITIATEAPDIRYASLPNLLRALRVTPEVWTVSDLELDPEFLGSSGSPTRVQRISVPARRESGDVLVVQQVGLAAAVAAVMRDVIGGW
jgi:electron transfer flavoprotein beta subunit